MDKSGKRRLKSTAKTMTLQKHPPERRERPRLPIVLVFAVGRRSHLTIWAWATIFVLCSTRRNFSKGWGSRSVLKTLLNCLRVFFAFQANSLADPSFPCPLCGTAVDDEITPVECTVALEVT